MQEEKPKQQPEKESKYELTEPAWLIVSWLCKEIIGPHHEIDRSLYTANTRQTPTNDPS